MSTDTVPVAAAPVEVVILAAGMGTRLGRALPKPLTPLGDGRSILHQQVGNLRSVLGPALPITVVVGYRAEEVVRAVPDLRFAYNEDYATTNTSRSLLRALTTSTGGVLWLNGDVVFDPRLLHLLRPCLEAGHSAVCVNTAAVGEEEVKYTVDADGYVAELSKTVVGGLGEAVGINYVCPADKPVLIEHLRACAPTDYFERGIETAISGEGMRVTPVDTSRYAAVEVDFEEDLARAQLIHPALAPAAAGVVAGTSWGRQTDGDRRAR